MSAVTFEPAMIKHTGRFGTMALFVGLSAVHCLFGYAGREIFGANVRDGVVLSMLSLLATWLVFGLASLPYRIVISLTACVLLIDGAYTEYGEASPRLYFHLHIVLAANFALVAAELILLRLVFKVALTSSLVTVDRAPSMRYSLVFLFISVACIAFSMGTIRRSWPQSMPPFSSFGGIWDAILGTVGASLILAPACLFIGFAGPSIKRLIIPLLVGVALTYTFQFAHEALYGRTLAEIQYVIPGSFAVTSVLSCTWLYLAGFRLQ